jgi:hypothetical protein
LPLLSLANFILINVLLFKNEYFLIKMVFLFLRDIDRKLFLLRQSNLIIDIKQKLFLNHKKFLPLINLANFYNFKSWTQLR